MQLVGGAFTQRGDADGRALLGLGQQQWVFAMAMAIGIDQQACKAPASHLAKIAAGQRQHRPLRLLAVAAQRLGQQGVGQLELRPRAHASAVAGDGRFHFFTRQRSSVRGVDGRQRLLGGVGGGNGGFFVAL